MDNLGLTETTYLWLPWGTKKEVQTLFCKENSMKNLVVITVILVFAINVSFAGDIKGKVKAKGAKHSGNAVIYIDEIPEKKFDPPKNHLTMDQKNLVFILHVLPIIVGIWQWSHPISFFVTKLKIIFSSTFYL